MSDLPAKPPVPNPETQRFWDATAEGRIDLPRCDGCGLAIWYPRTTCPDCQSPDVTWTELSGRGVIYSYTVVRAGASRTWREHMPYVLAYVRLDEGPTMMTNIVDCDVDEVRVGMAVHAVFDDTGEGSAIVRFTPT